SHRPVRVPTLHRVGLRLQLLLEHDPPVSAGIDGQLRSSRTDCRLCSRSADAGPGNRTSLGSQRHFPGALRPGQLVGHYLLHDQLDLHTASRPEATAQHAREQPRLENIMIGDLKGKVAIVTGAGQGIGEGIARCFAKAGARVLIATRTAKNGQAVADSIVQNGGVASLLQTDVGLHEQVKRAVAHAVSTYGRLDIVVHNAAVYPVLPIEQLSDADLDMTLSVNLKAGFWFIQAAVPHLRNQGGGRFLFTSSVTGPNVAMPGTAHYA